MSKKVKHFMTPRPSSYVVRTTKKLVSFKIIICSPNITVDKVLPLAPFEMAGSVDHGHVNSEGMKFS